MGVCSGDRARPILLPSLRAYARDAPSKSGHLRDREGVNRTTRAQVVDRDVDRLGNTQRFPLQEDCEYRGGFEQSADRSPMQRTDERVANQVIGVGQLADELVAAQRDIEPEKATIWKGSRQLAGITCLAGTADNIIKAFMAYESLLPRWRSPQEKS